jgi:hypothetical protein
MVGFLIIYLILFSLGALVGGTCFWLIIERPMDLFKHTFTRRGQ